MENQIENDKLLAEFMGWDINDPTTFPKTIQQPIYDGCWGDYRFHTSWDWLMPVLKKINPQPYSQWRMISRPTEYNICDVYEQAVEFIQWYNEQE
jgi:hypothetical protein